MDEVSPFYPNSLMFVLTHLPSYGFIIIINLSHAMGAKRYKEPSSPLSAAIKKLHQSNNAD